MRLGTVMNVSTSNQDIQGPGENDARTFQIQFEELEIPMHIVR